MTLALLEAVRQKSLAQWSHRTIIRNKSDHLLTGLLFDDAGHRMVPTHATKAGVHYRYYVSTPFLHEEAKTASAGSVSRVPAADIEDTVLKSLKAHLAAKQDGATSSALRLVDRGTIAQLVAGIVVHRDRLVIQFKSITQTKHPIAQMIGRSGFPGKSRHPKDPAGSCSRTIRPQAHAG